MGIQGLTKYIRSKIDFPKRKCHRILIDGNAQINDIMPIVGIRIYNGIKV